MELLDGLRPVRLPQRALASLGSDAAVTQKKSPTSNAGSRGFAFGIGLILELDHFCLNRIIVQDTVGEGHVATGNRQVEFTVLMASEAGK